MTNEANRQLLLRIARDAIVAHVNAMPVVAVQGWEVLDRSSGVFVSIHKLGELRGCIGHIEADEPLGRVIPRCAVAACSEDPRFPPVSAAELPQLAVELSLLGPLDPVLTPEAIEVGRHGLVVERDWHRGLLLPQVATDWRWDRETFLAETCRKAGLPHDAWRHGAQLWTFEAEVFGER